MFGVRGRCSILALVLGLAACAAPVPQPAVSFKRTGAEIYSAAAFLPPKIAGDWRQVAGYSTSDTPGCPAGALRFEPGSSGLVVRGKLCLNGQVTPVSGPVTMVGPGRMSIAGMTDWWVIWVDSGYRTLAVATPSGQFGFVLDRDQIPRDRLVAAGEIFDFNGYSRARLRAY